VCAACVHVCGCVHIYVCACVHVYAHECVCTCMCVCMFEFILSSPLTGAPTITTQQPAGMSLEVAFSTR